MPVDDRVRRRGGDGGRAVVFDPTSRCCANPVHARRHHQPLNGVLMCLHVETASPSIRPATSSCSTRYHTGDTGDCHQHRHHHGPVRGVMRVGDVSAGPWITRVRRSKVDPSVSPATFTRYAADTGHVSRAVACQVSTLAVHDGRRRWEHGHPQRIRGVKTSTDSDGGYSARRGPPALPLAPAAPRSVRMGSRRHS